MKITQTLGALLLAGMALSTANATTFVFPFTSPNGDVGSSSHAYTITVGAASATITASTLVSSGNPVDLWGKNLGTDENGLGTAGNTDHEIVPTDAIVFDFSAITNIQQISIQMASVQASSHDLWSLYGSNTAPTFTNKGTAILVGQSTDQALTNTFLGIYPATENTLYKYYTVTAVAAAGYYPDVLVGGITVVTGTSQGAAPEPGTFALMGLASLGLMAGIKLRNRVN